MSKQSALSMILQKNHVELSDLQNKSRIWFDYLVQGMRKVSNKTPQSLMRGDQQSKGNRIIPGHLYMFMYDPKYKETLPYYDTFPMVFPFEQKKDGFLGLNLHYLPYHLRARLMDRLLELKSDSRYDERTKLRLQWSLIGASSKFAMIRPCVKHYLYKHVESPFKAIHSNDWATALMLPCEQFQKMSPQQVWAESIRIIRK